MTTTMHIHVRRACQADAAAISALGSEHYPKAYEEAVESIYEKLKSAKASCWVATADGYVVGYGLAFPYLLNECCPLTSAAYEEIREPNCTYIHDLCVSARFRGLKLARQLVEKIIEANALPHLALTAVLGSQAFWAQFGFQTARLLEYHGTPAHYMTRPAKL